MHPEPTVQRGKSLHPYGISLDGSSVEIDETYVGGLRRGQRGRPDPDHSHKTCVVGVVERKGRVVAIAANDATKKTLHGIAKEYILPDSVIYTDDY